MSAEGCFFAPPCSAVLAGMTTIATRARMFIPSIATSTLVAAIATFLLGGLVDSIADDTAAAATTEVGTHAS
jgi:hypothetical protein